jgi:hypothetical protein
VKKVLVALLALVAIASIAGNFFLYQRYSTSRPVVRIGGDAITLKEYRDSLEYQFGKPVLTKLTLMKLVMNAARKAGVSPKKTDVDSRIAEIERRQPKQLEEAQRDPVKMAELRQELMTDIALENLTIKDVKVTDGQTRAFYNQHKALFQVPTQAKTTIVIADSPVDAATAEQLLHMKNMTPATIANTQPRLHVVGINGVNVNWGTLPASEQARLSNAVMHTSEHGVTKVLIGKQYFIARVDSVGKGEVVPYEKIRPQVERAARLAKAEPRDVVLARLYKKADIKFEIPRYEEYFRQFADNADRLIELASAKSK